MSSAKASGNPFSRYSRRLVYPQTDLNVTFYRAKIKNPLFSLTDFITYPLSIQILARQARQWIS
jgi:hypothetical protein